MKMGSLLLTIRVELCFFQFVCVFDARKPHEIEEAMLSQPKCLCNGGLREDLPAIVCTVAALPCLGVHYRLSLRRCSGV